LKKGGSKRWGGKDQFAFAREKERRKRGKLGARKKAKGEIPHSKIK